MDRHETLYRLEEPTRLETFFGDCFSSGGEILTYRFGDRINLDITLDTLRDVSRPSNDFLWSTDKTSLAYLGSRVFDRFMLEEKGPLGGDEGIGLVKMPRYLNLVDLSIDLISFVYVLRGKRRMVIDGDTVDLEAGNMVVYFPRVAYSSIFVDPENITIHMCVRSHIILNRLSGMLSINGPLSDFLGAMFCLSRDANYLLVKAPPD